ncbi:lipase domain-containing protein [Phthorimaea operculella]|nr:lipase domain-containing protein [Phthorimaea operculella]
MNQVLKDRFLAQGDYNVIVMDWSRLANSGYATAATGVPAVGRGLGHLGAHLVGNAGRYLRSQVSRITGLDPSGPLWQLNSDRLSASDAVYVEVIHTDGGLTGLGIGSDLGNVDFYVNGGNSQPGCLTSICDHNRAWEVFAASIIHQHLIGRESGRFRVNTGRRYPF